MMESVIAKYKVIILYELIISAVKAGNVPQMTQHNHTIHNHDNINSIKILSS